MISDEEITIRKGELMLPHECTMKGQYITIRTAIIAVFVVMTPITTMLTYYVSNSSSSLNAQIQLQLLPMLEKDKQVLSRIISLEESRLEDRQNSRETLNLLREIKTDLKYNFVTKKEFRSEMNKKVDMNRIDKRNLKD